MPLSAFSADNFYSITSLICSRTGHPKLDNGVRFKAGEDVQEGMPRTSSGKNRNQIFLPGGKCYNTSAITPGKPAVLEGTTATRLSFPAQLGAEPQKKAPPSRLCLGRAYWSEALSWALTPREQQYLYYLP